MRGLVVRLEVVEDLSRREATGDSASLPSRRGEPKVTKQHRTLTWEEFKAVVDAKLKEQNLPQTVDIWYIDLGMHSTPEDVQIEYHDSSGISVWA